MLDELIKLEVKKFLNDELKNEIREEVAKYLEKNPSFLAEILKESVADLARKSGVVEAIFRRSLGEAVQKEIADKLIIQIRK